MVKDILPSLKTKGRPDLGLARRGRAGGDPGDRRGARHDGADWRCAGRGEGRPANNAGLQRGDAITELDGKKVLVAAEIPEMIAFGHIGKTVTSTVLRQGKTMAVKAVVAAMPEK